MNFLRILISLPALLIILTFEANVKGVSNKIVLLNSLNIVSLPVYDVNQTQEGDLTVQFVRGILIGHNNTT